MKPASHAAIQVRPEIDDREELIDTYELFAGIFKESGGQYSHRPKLDPSLPLIYGKPATVRQQICHFLSQVLVESSRADDKIVLISHTKDRRYWIFNLHILGPTAEAVPNQSLLIHKGSIQSINCNVLYQLHAS